jgi:hypothetical protein
LKWPRELISAPAGWKTAAAQVPPRTSLLDDILFYYRESQQPNHQTIGDIAALTKNIALSNWNQFSVIYSEALYVLRIQAGRVSGDPWLERKKIHRACNGFSRISIMLIVGSAVVLIIATLWKQILWNLTSPRPTV